MKPVLALVALSFSICFSAHAATQTENLGIRALPAPGKVLIDGKTDDWDLSGGIFACDNVETLRDSFAVWFHLMHDEKYLYLLGNFVDETPLNNPGQIIGSYGFSGDSIQTRIFFGATQGIAENESPDARISHWTCWRGSDKNDIMDVAYGQKFNQGNLKDAKTEGAQQGFQIWPDGKGYSHEIAIPWKLVNKSGTAPKPGERFVITFEPNFTVGTKGRLSVKDNFKGGIALDRVFTFQGPRCWGWATLENAGKVEVRPVRLSDGREFPVALNAGKLVADWSGLIKNKEIPGFKPIKFTLESDGYVSLNIFRKDGTVARQLLNNTFMTKGSHEVKWDGLTTWSWTQPGEVVEAGEYTWCALVHPGLKLSLKGWACNSGSAPWDGPSGKENWGGDHGVPSGCAAEGNTVFLGWTGAEAGKALVAVDLKGNVKWLQKRQGMCGAERVAVDGGLVYAVNWGPDKSNYVYRVNAKDGSYAAFAGTSSPDIFPRDLWPDPKGKPDRVDGLDVKNKKIYLSYTSENTVMQVNADTGKLIKSFTVKSPSEIAVLNDSLVYIISDRSEVLSLETASGQTKAVIPNLKQAHGITIDKQGAIYVSMRDPDNQVKVFSAEGKLMSTIGRQGGRATRGPWNPDGLTHAAEIAIDSQGKLWVAEASHSPKRVSVWDLKTGAFENEFFGPATYGALGGAINPQDPNLMIGQGCEWRIDPKTGRAICTGVVTTEGMENTRFGTGSNGRLYVAVATRWSSDLGRVNVFERLGEGDFKLRSTFFYADASGEEAPPPAHGKTGNIAKTGFWADANDDQQRQPDEITLIDGIHRFSGWYMPMSPDLTFCATGKRYPVSGYTACGAPKWNIAAPETIPAPPKSNTGVLGTTDGKFVLYGGAYGETHARIKCFDVASGKTAWEYPDNFVGVHGSHKACPPEVGMIRGSYGPCGTAKLPEPLGNVWAIATNVGEWHLMTERGFYLSSLFQGDPMKVVWPEAAVPGALMNDTPPGMGGEDFGGSITLAKDGKLYIQTGKTGFWNVEVNGLDLVKAIDGDKIVLAETELAEAQKIRDHAMQAAVGKRSLTIRKSARTFSGSLQRDFSGADIVDFKKTDDAAVRAAASWDDQNLYLAWEVKDATPWMNAAELPEEMYLNGDTVDFQLGTDAKANKSRSEAVLGDLRLSIGNLKGKAVAVLYRKVSQEKHPKTFTSGVIKDYVMESVKVLENCDIKVTRQAKAYCVEAAVPLSALGLKPAAGLTLSGDFGATHGDPAGKRTRLRTHWSNQATGIVDDAVFELKMEPKNWGEFIFN